MIFRKRVGSNEVVHLLERITMDKNKELVKNTAIISIGKFCTQFLSFLLLPFYTSILSTAEYGTVDLLVTYQQLIVYVAFFQIEQAIFRFLVDVRGDKKGIEILVTSCFTFAIFQGAILGCIFKLLKYFTNINYIGHLYFYVFAVIMASCMLQVARGLGKNTIYALGSLIAAVSTIGFNILFLAAFKMGIAGMLKAYILGYSFCTFFVFFSLKIYNYVNLHSFQKNILKKCLTYSIPLVPNSLSWWVMSASDRTVVAFFLGKDFNGLLTVAHKIPGAYSTFYSVFNLAWTESAVLHINDPDAESFFANTIQKMFRLFSAAAIGIIACLPFVFNILINKNYFDAYYQIPIYMIASLCQVFQGMYSVIYIALKKTKEVAKSTVVSATINLIVCVVLIKYIGLYAASLSTVVSYLFLCIWRYFDLKKYIKVNFDIKLLTSTIVMYALVCFGYYSFNRVVQAVVLFITIAYCCYINSDILMVILRSPKNIKNIITGKH